MKIKMTSLLVDDQSKALTFYTEKLGFQKKEDIAMGAYRWLTIIAEDDGLELVLEPNAFPAAVTYQKALYEAGIPSASFESDDIDAEYAALVKKGVQFKSAPKDVGGKTFIAVFDDTCGNWVQIYQSKL